ncbi:MAG: DUF480 domain-containing protein [Desulfobacterales bacterium]|nr:DUF480 domain-containing protein [Desulfobacterales bacterium]
MPKYEQLFSTNLNLVPREKAAICILLLRGPQTSGEIRSRTERLYSFKSIDEVQETLQDLDDAKLVVTFPRQPGRKESRHMHLLGGEPDTPALATTSQSQENAVIVRKKNDSVIELQEQIDGLRLELQTLKRKFEIFKSQFE